MIPTGIFCDYQNGQEMYCYSEGKPDLVISDVWAYNTTPGVYSELRALVYNHGHGYAGKFSVAFFIDGSYVGEVEVNGLGANENTVARISYPHPCEGETDTFAAQVDYHNEVDEENENDNYHESPRIFQCSGGEMPNLEVVEAYIDYQDFCRALNYRNSSIVVVVANTGEQASPQTGGWIYIDGNSRGGFDIPSLQPGEETTISMNFPYMCEGSSDEIRVVVDSRNYVVESNENDNEYTFITDCIPMPSGTADLVVSYLETHVVEELLAGGLSYPLKSEINYTVENLGEDYSCNAEVGLFIDGVFQGQQYLPPLAPGDSITRTFIAKYDWERCSGISDTLTLKADVNNDVAESNENNNERSVTLYCIEYPLIKPDLTVEDVWIEGEGASNLDIVFTVKNIGLAASRATNAYVGVNYNPAGSTPIPPLNAGESVELRISGFTAQWQENTIEVCADSGNLVDEIPNEMNNCLTKTITIEDVGCYDGVRNRDEVGVDCGGYYCVPCGFVEVKGRLLYQDDDGSWLPVKLTKIRTEGDFNWGPFLTDSDGYFTIPIPDSQAGKKFRIRIEPWDINYAARIARDLDRCNEYVWFLSDEITVPDHGRLDLGELRIGKDANYDFTAYWQEKRHTCLFGLCACGGSVHVIQGGSVYLNIADALLAARAYADLHRSDDDGIGRVDVQYPDSEWSNYNYNWDEITLTKDSNTDHGFVDGAAIHEYGHFLEDKISEEDVYVGDTSHTFCSDKDDTEFAWSEGFAEYYGTFIVAINDHLSHPDINYYNIENPYCSKFDDDIEATVAAVLWDMVDNSSFPDYDASESFDTVGGLDDVIFKMLDSELDHWYDAPDLCEMHGKLDHRLDSTTLNKVERIFEHYNACR
jgi:subtilase family serine protease